MEYEYEGEEEGEEEEEEARRWGHAGAMRCE